MTGRPRSSPRPVDLYRHLQKSSAQQRTWRTTSDWRVLAGISEGAVGEGIIERSIAHFRSADPEYGERVAQGVKERRG